jgi:hypothetical protein
VKLCNSVMKVIAKRIPQRNCEEKCRAVCNVKAKATTCEVSLSICKYECDHVGVVSFTILSHTVDRRIGKGLDENCHAG